MTYNDSTRKASAKYRAAHIKRVPFDMQITDYERLKLAAAEAGESVNGYIKRAISERMEREGNPSGGGMVRRESGEVTSPNSQNKK